jgi:Rrf2 family iron-sulfur cluster assembly transcriptional regulator
MQITRQADYAIRAVRYLSNMYLIEEKPAATWKIAEDQHIPPSFLAKIISQLYNRNLVATSRGAGGGVRLNRHPKDISLLDVVEAIDGPILLNECVSDTNFCTLESDCPLKPIWGEAQVELVGKLRSTTFDQFTDGHKS